MQIIHAQSHGFNTCALPLPISCVFLKEKLSLVLHKITPAKDPSGGLPALPAVGQWLAARCGLSQETNQKHLLGFLQPSHSVTNNTVFHEHNFHRVRMSSGLTGEGEGLQQGWIRSAQDGGNYSVLDWATYCL